MRTLCLGFLWAIPCVMGFPVMGCGGGSGDVDAGADADVDASPEVDAALPDPPVFEAAADPEVMTGCATERPAAGVTRAKLIECEEERPSGSVAMARNGDILLENTRVRVVLRASSDEAAVTIGGYAGGIVDAARQGGSDLLKEVYIGFDLATARPTDIVIVEAGDDGPARVRVLYELDQLLLIAGAVGGAGVLRTPNAFGAVDYELRPDEDVLRVTVQISPGEGTARIAGRPSFLALTGAAELMQPGASAVLSDDELGGSHGAWLVGESAADAYALRIVHAGGTVAHIDSIHIVQSSDRVVVQAGEIGQWELRLAMTERAADAFRGVVVDEDALQELEVQASPGERVEVRQGETLRLRTRVDEAGLARVPVPPGPVDVRAGFDAFFEGEVVSGEGSLTLSEAPRAGLAIDAAAGGEVAPLRVTVEREGEELLRQVAFGATRFELPPGDVRVTLSRGPEYDVHAEDVTLVAGSDHVISVDLPRVVDTSGWVAGDFHLHSEMSPDSQHALPDAVRLVAAEGLEVVASTDHDVLTDYRPLLAQAGLSEWVLAITGAEVSDPILAHINGYPLVVDPARSGGGAPRWFEQTPLDTFDSLRALGDADLGGAIVQVNHPRRNGSGWFRAIMLDPVTGMSGSSPADIGLPDGADPNDFDFDVIETFNAGLNDSDEMTLADHLGLWANGWRFGMMGNSDSHDSGKPAGITRTYIRVPDDARGAFDWMDVGAGIRAGEITVSGGIFITAEAGAVAGDSVPLRVVIRAAPWVEVDRVRIYAGPSVVIDESVPASTDEVRLDEVFDVPLGGSDFVVARTSGARALPPVISGQPFGITNPIEVR